MFFGGVLMLDVDLVGYGLGFFEDGIFFSSWGGCSLSYFFGLNDLVIGS